MAAQRVKHEMIEKIWSFSVPVMVIITWAISLKRIEHYEMGQIEAGSIYIN